MLCRFMLNEPQWMSKCINIKQLNLTWNIISPGIPQARVTCWKPNPSIHQVYLFLDEQECLTINKIRFCFKFHLSTSVNMELIHGWFIWKVMQRRQMTIHTVYLGIATNNLYRLYLRLEFQMFSPQDTTTSSRSAHKKQHNETKNQKPKT